LRLASAVRSKDRKATAEFVEAYADLLYAYLAHRLFPNMSHAEDLVQEVFLTALQNIGGYGGKSSLRSWLLGIARHKVEDHYRRVLKESPMDDVETLEIESAEQNEDAGFQDYERARAAEILGRLREDYRLLLRWKYWDRKSASEMAAATGKTGKAIKRALSRARAQFRKRWEDACV